MGCQVVEAPTRFPRSGRIRTRNFGSVREWSSYSEAHKGLRLSGVLSWAKRQGPHLIGRGHMPGHRLDQLYRDWLKSDGIAVSFCPDLRMKWHKLMLLNTIVI
jgi:hypothetical protein